MQRNVVFVTFNYRLGVFGILLFISISRSSSYSFSLGFLSFKDPALNVPGNAGLKDQVFALKWIKKNIQNFGGDPNNITISGESAGGVSVHYHTISNQSKNLFKRAIPISGTALHKIWSISPNRNSAYKLAVKLGWDEVGGEKEILEFLEEADPFKIVETHESMQFREVSSFSNFWHN